MLSMPPAGEELVMNVDPAAYKETLAHWATGVTVVSTLDGERPIGITANSFTSLSLNPPQVLVSVSKRLRTHDAILERGAFAVSILRREQEEVGRRFAGGMAEAGDRFAGLNVQSAETGCPILSDALAWLDCEVAAAYEGADHTHFVGAVVAASGAQSDDSASPLLYFKRAWRSLPAEE